MIDSRLLTNHIATKAMSAITLCTCSTNSGKRLWWWWWGELGGLVLQWVELIPNIRQVRPALCKTPTALQNPTAPAQHRPASHIPAAPRGACCPHVLYAATHRAECVHPHLQAACALDQGCSQEERGANRIVQSPSCRQQVAALNAAVTCRAHNTHNHSRGRDYAQQGEVSQVTCDTLHCLLCHACTSSRGMSSACQ
jgi:hypothetical protein